MKPPSRLGLLRRSPDFGLLFLATAGSAFGTYVAAIALVVHVKQQTGSGVWVAALLIAEFAPIVLIGLLFGPLVDRLSRRWLMVVSDLVRVALFVALIFVHDPLAIVVVAAAVGIATGFFRPAVYAGLPNLVDDEELTNANSLLQTVETLAWMIGPVLAGLLLTVWSPSVPYAVNALTFVLSAYLIYLIPESKLRSQESLTAGHWRDVADGLRLVVVTPPLRAVLVVWSVVLLGSAAVNVAEVFFAQDVLLAGNVGFGVIVGASGVGLAIGSYLAAPAIGRVGLRRHYIGSIALMGFGWGAAAFSTSIYVAVPFVVAAAIGNGAAIVANQLFVQRGATDRYRGRALATIMSANYAVLGAAMALAGLATDVYGARAVWIASAVIFFSAALVGVGMTRWLKGAREERLLEAYAQAAEETLARTGSNGKPRSAPLGEDAPATGLERIAALLEEIEERREDEARRVGLHARARSPQGGAAGSVEAGAEP